MILLLNFYDEGAKEFEVMSNKRICVKTKIQEPNGRFWMNKIIINIERHDFVMVMVYSYTWSKVTSK